MRLSRPLEVITPTVDGDILTVLGRLRERAFELMTDELRAWPHPPALAAVFGSAARQQEAPDSDIDVLLIPPGDRDEGAWQHAVTSFTCSVSHATGNDVRVLELTTDELWAPG